MIFDESISSPDARLVYERRRSELARVIHDANQLVIEVFNVLKTQPNKEPQHNHVAVLLLTRHAMEMVDGVGVLVEKGCAEPCKNLLRSALEAALGVLYIIEGDSARRNLAYQLAQGAPHPTRAICG